MISACGLTSLTLFLFNKSFTMTDMAIGSGLFLMFAAFSFPLFYILKPGYITTVLIISFLVLTAVGPTIATFLAEHLTAITDFIVSLSVPVLYSGTALLIIVLYAASWGVSTTIYQRKVF